MRRKVLCVVGTRPEAIKMAPVLEALRAEPEHFETRLCAVAQHRSLLDAALAPLGLHPDHDLDVMTPAQRPADVLARAVAGLAPLLEAERPGVVVAQGDTVSTVAAAMSAFYAGVPFAHVEAGLRSASLDRPFPEEANRRLADCLGRWLFAPTTGARDHLLREGVSPDRVVVTGNTGIDALIGARGRASEPAWAEKVEAIASRHGLRDHALVLVTCHRRESFGAPLVHVCRALRRIADRRDATILLPLHPNPAVATTLRAELDGSEVVLTPPLEHPVFAALLERSTLVLTDSGGIQEETCFLGTPTLVLRDVTERPEAVAAGVARLVGTDEREIVHWATRLLDDPEARASMEKPSTAYGDGHAAERIVAALHEP